MDREVFISYSRKDKTKVLAIKKELEKIPGVNCWMDLNNIESGNPAFDVEIVKGIKNSKVFLFMLSTNSQKSDWAINEMNLALRISKDTGGSLKVVMVNIDGCELNYVLYLRYNRMDMIEWNNNDQKAKLLRDILRWVNNEAPSTNESESESSQTVSDILDLSIGDLLKRAKECEKMENYSEAFRLYGQAAHLGDVSAQCKVAYMLYAGKGVKQNAAQAYKWCRMAVDQNYAPAQNFLGRMYFHGRGVEQSYQEALNWCRMSANQGYVNAQRMLGDLFLRGKGDDIPQDYLKAASWYRKAAEIGDAESQYKYGNMYYHGQGVDQDFVEAIIWFRKSSEQNYPEALVSLGYMYTKGIGVNKNLAEAAKYYGLAMNIYQRKAEQGDKKAQERLAKLKEKM